jgi:hypothetical protein
LTDTTRPDDQEPTGKAGQTSGIVIPRPTESRSNIQRFTPHDPSVD